MSSPRNIGREVAKIQDALFNRDATLASAEQQLVETIDTEFITSEDAHSRGWKWGLVAVASAAVIVIVAAMVFSSSKHPITYRINGAPADEVGAQWIDTHSRESKTLDFSEGSQIQLSSASRVRCFNLTENGAHIVLGEGQLHANIVSGKSTNWRFSAGPFDVEVTGTQFDLSWNPRESLLSLVMDEGSVQVVGPIIAQRRTVLAGERLRAWVDEQKIEVAPWSGVTSSQGAKDEPASQLSSNGTPSDGLHKNPGMKCSQENTTSMPTSDGARREARRIERDRCPYSGSAEALRAADRTRRQKSWHKAYMAYRQVRTCYPASRDASVATFYLGKISFDQRHNWREAARWFTKYLSNPKDLGLVREAQGRLLESLVQMNDRRRAITIARKYLENYPNGPHAHLAKSVEEGAD